MGFLSGWWMTALGWGAAVGMGFLFVGAREELAAEIERCNTAKLAAVAEAERLVRVAVQAGLQEEIDRLLLQTERAERARQIAQEAARLAEARIPEVREIIREVANEDVCIDTAVPTAVLDSLRD